MFFENGFSKYFRNRNEVIWAPIETQKDKITNIGPWKHSGWCEEKPTNTARSRNKKKPVTHTPPVILVELFLVQVQLRLKEDDPKVRCQHIFRLLFSWFAKVEPFASPCPSQLNIFCLRGLRLQLDVLGKKMVKRELLPRF